MVRIHPGSPATYTPFGGVHVSTGAPPTARFPGQWFQSESGLHQNWMRDYDPTTGRYLQADPLGLIDGASVYGYAGQNPMMNMDPSGQCIGPWAIVCAGAAWGVASVYIGWLLDPDWYTLYKAMRDFTVGFAFGGFGAAWNAAAKAGAAASNASKWTYGQGKNAQKWANKMQKRGWTPRQIDEAISSGKPHSAPNNLNPSNGATRYVHPKTGRSVVLDDVTREIIHVGGDGYKY